MSTKVQLVCLLLGALLAFPKIAHAGTDLIILTAAGEAYNGDPIFRILANEKPIGAGAVPNAVDTSNGSHLTAPIDTSYIARFVFTVPTLKDIEVIDIEFLNDAWAGEGKPGNRNLYVIAITLSVVESISEPLHIRTVDFGPASFRPQTPGQQGVNITQQWAKLASNSRLRLLRPPGGWLSQPMISSEPEKKGAITGSLPPVEEIETANPAPPAKEEVSTKSKSSASKPEKTGAITGILARLKKKKATNAAPAAKKEVSTKPKTSASKREKKEVNTGSLPPVQKTKAANAVPATKEEVSTKAKKSTSNAPAESKVTEPEIPATDSEEQPKPRSYSRYAVPKEKCRRIGEKGTDRLC